MKRTIESRRSSRRIVPALISSTLALLLVGCTSSQGASNASAGGEGLEAGATKEEYIAAFEDVDPIELNFQIADTSLESYAAQRDLEFADQLSEWSGGKISVNVHPSNAIAGPTDVPDALADGRLDLAQYYVSYEPQEMPAADDLLSSMVQAPGTPLVGEIVNHAVMQEVSFNNEDIMEDFSARGLHVITPGITNGNNMLLCVDPKDALEDHQGSQIRTNSGTLQQQIEAIGGVASSVEYSEVYEAFQRGILDCSIQAASTVLASGWQEVAPYAVLAERQSFAPANASLVAGAKWEQLPLVAQQLVFDLMHDYISAEFYNVFESIKELSAATGEAGGNITYLDEVSEDELIQTNKQILDEVANSDTTDGAALNSEVAKSIDKWTTIAEELGYTEGGDVADFDSWYEGSSDFADREYLQPIAERMFEEIYLPQRPH